MLRAAFFHLNFELDLIAQYVNTIHGTMNEAKGRLHDKLAELTVGVSKQERDEIIDEHSSDYFLLNYIFPSLNASCEVAQVSRTGDSLNSGLVRSWLVIGILVTNVGESRCSS
jgi:hypothetical protein